ncbi:hypothetical protein PoB_004590100 [Plakobranchus ocellatus]|uniref:Uncharacterized protein n=1 Tax=Plakobranchus ocellatus TaxID=259542 RepID=A0AAV4BKA0_9GAST|nr:hypothetical protein PoB_004590100 [Plakobranchus ocellatus]
MTLRRIGERRESCQGYSLERALNVKGMQGLVWLLCNKARLQQDDLRFLGYRRAKASAVDSNWRHKGFFRFQGGVANHCGTNISCRTIT